jgi:hypothetical protein
MGKDGKAEYKVIKADGKQLDIDMKSAIEEEKDIPSIYKADLLQNGNKFLKIAFLILKWEILLITISEALSIGICVQKALHLPPSFFRWQIIILHFTSNTGLHWSMA